MKQAIRICKKHIREVKRAMGKTKKWQNSLNENLGGQWYALHELLRELELHDPEERKP